MGGKNDYQLIVYYVDPPINVVELNIFFCQYVNWVVNYFQEIGGLLSYVSLAHDLNNKHMSLG
jgi:hypothetical protein